MSYRASGIWFQRKPNLRSTNRQYFHSWPIVKRYGSFVACPANAKWNVYRNENKLQSITARAPNYLLYAVAIIIYKVKNGIAPSYIAKLFNKTISRYALRIADLTIPRIIFFSWINCYFWKADRTCIPPQPEKFRRVSLVRASKP